MTSTSMRIALLCNNYPPEFAGGTERVVEALAGALVAAGDHVVVIAGSELPRAEDGDDWQREERHGVTVYRVPRLASESYQVLVERPRLLGVVQDILREEQIQVQHVHHWSHLSDHLVRGAKELGIPSVVTLHDLWTTCPRFFRLPPAGVTCPSGVERGACVACVQHDWNEPDDVVALTLEQRDKGLSAEWGGASFVTVPSAFCAASAATHLPGMKPDGVRIVPHGLLDERAAEPRGPLGLPMRVGTFGNLNAEKGVLQLIEAMANQRAELHLYGAVADEFRTLGQERADALGVNVTWHGFYDEGGPHPAAQLDVAVFPSLCQETYGLVVEEALHQGTPVLVAESGALPERVEAGGGLSVPAGDVPALAEAIEGLVSDRDAYHLLRASIPTVFATIASAAENYRTMYWKSQGTAQTQA